MPDENTESAALPFKPPEKQIAGSRSKNVLGYEKDPLLIKVEKSPFQKTYPTTSEALDSAKKFNFYRQLISEEVKKANGHPEIVTPAFPVIHEGYGKDSISITEAQKEIQNGRTLRQIGKSVFDLPQGSLTDLKSIFSANISMHKKTGEFLDITGSTNKKRGLKNLFLRNLLPLMYSENIVVDEENNIHLVDVGIFNKSVQKNYKNFLLTRLQYLGSIVSNVLIDRTIKKRLSKESK